MKDLEAMYGTDIENEDNIDGMYAVDDELPTVSNNKNEIDVKQNNKLTIVHIGNGKYITVPSINYVQKLENTIDLLERKFRKLTYRISRQDSYIKSITKELNDFKREVSENMDHTFD